MLSELRPEGGERRRCRTLQLKVLGSAVRVRMASHAAPTAGRVLASMRPYTVVAAVSRVRGRSFGLALSDPYLSHATPLSTVRGTGNAVLCAGMLSFMLAALTGRPSCLFAAPRFRRAAKPGDGWRPVSPRRDR
jgi:hypothetical protein